MGVLYTSFTLFAVAASPVVRWLGASRALVIGTSGYLLFILANLVPTWYTMVPASLYLGFTASIIWVGQGTYLTSAALSHARDNSLPDGPTLGSFNGEFWGVFASTQVIGNLISLALLRNGKDGGSITGKNLLFVVFLGCMIIGIVLMCLLSKRDEKRDNASTHSSFGAMLKYIVAPLKDRRMILLIPLIAYSGLQQAFVWAVFTKSIVTPVLGISGVGGAMAIYGASDVVCSLVAGRFTSGLHSATFIVSVGAIVQAVVLFWLLLFYSPVEGLLGAAIPLFIGALWGVGDGVLNTQLSALLGLLFEDVKILFYLGILSFLPKCSGLAGGSTGGSSFCTVEGLAIRCHCSHLLLEPKHHTTSNAYLDGRVTRRLLWLVPVTYPCCREAIKHQSVRQILFRCADSVVVTTWLATNSMYNHTVVLTSDMKLRRKSIIIHHDATPWQRAHHAIHGRHCLLEV
uniref:UNC93-like protein 3 n=1 Tax=Aegilops tauschii TaxID=37682 RepID=N1R1A4_AEGTA